MALKSTVFKADIQVADIDHGYYADHTLTLARHPSETDERMMVRLCALALQAHTLQTVCGGDGTLALGAGLSDPDEPDVWLRDYTGRVRLWVEVGQPDDKPLMKACSRADAVVLYAYGMAAEVWWRGIAGKLERAQRLSVYRIGHDQAQALLPLAQRSMRLQATVQEGVLLLGDGSMSVSVEPLRWK
ncbi:MAG: YaeQ family protein [Rhodoferax sp.]|nr:YaeQ family protein [Rhodoferax sp.]